MTSSVPPRYAQQLRELARLTRRYQQLLGRSLELNESALDALDHLGHEGALTPTELAERLGISPGATTSVVRRLEQSGHAHRERHAADGRSVRLVPDEASGRLAAERHAPLLAALAARLDRYSPEQLALVSAVLDDIAAAYREGIERFEN